MAILHTKNVTVRGVSGAVPSKIQSIQDIYQWDGVEQFIGSVGILERRISPDKITASDLCIAAAKKLIAELKWNKEDIEAIIFVSQTPDYILPATSCVIQKKLGLSKSCYTLDISLGCSGWVYALSVISSLMQTGSIKKGLLLAGDTITKLCSSEDKSTFPLFGDAGTATALEYKEGSDGFKFVMNSDGDGMETIMVHDGGFRHSTSPNSFETYCKGDGIIRNPLQLDLDGMDVFSFGISKAPKSIKELSRQFGIDLDAVDIFTFHQANFKMNEIIRKKLKINLNKVPYSLQRFGNTSCASIPLSLVTCEAERLRTESLTHIACGFGVGLSWGSVWFETDNICVPNLVEI